MRRLLLRDTLLDGRPCDLRVEAGTITERRWRDEPGAAPLAPNPGEDVVTGGMITPPFAEPHVHLDAALLGQQAPNRSGTLREGINNWARLRAELTTADVQRRAITTAEMYAKFGTLRIRTHVDTGSTLAVEALLALEGELADRGIELQVVAFPQEGILRAPGRREAWERAVELGCHAVGGIPHFERTAQEGLDSVRLVFDLAEKHGRLIDFHCDETDDPHSRNLELVCAQAMDRGFEGRVVAGHCTALHSYNNPHAAKVIELVAESRVQVVANPLDNSVLQGRYDHYPKRRGLTRVDQLWDAGALVGIGHDSVQDPWYRLGTANMLDAAHMLVHMGHLTSEDQLQRTFRTLWHDNHLPFGGAPELAPGARAQFLWWELTDPVAILTHRPLPRVYR